MGLRVGLERDPVDLNDRNARDWLKALVCRIIGNVSGVSKMYFRRPVGLRSTSAPATRLICFPKLSQNAPPKARFAFFTR